MKPSVLFITKICFLDAALEYIDEVKNYVNLRVIIEIDPFSKDKNIINIDNLPDDITFIDVKQLLNPTDYLNFKPYIDGCKSFQFLVYQNIKSFSFSSIKKSYFLYKKIKEKPVNFIHFDDISVRLITFAFFLNLLKAKLIMNVHDPVQHSGERNFKNIFANKIFYLKVTKFVTFSQYSCSILIQKQGRKKNCISLNLKPYKFYSNYVKTDIKEQTYITFIGRVSEYKGIDIFLDSIKILNKKYADVNYIIAGAPYNNTIGVDLVNKYKFTNVKFILNHLTNIEVCDFIQQSKVIICPYRDATQSGVVMTALALNTPIIVSNQGGLPEYIQNNITGLIANTDAESFAKAIETVIVDPLRHIQFSENIRKIDPNKFMFGENRILNLYS